MVKMLKVRVMGTSNEISCDELFVTVCHFSSQFY